MRMSPDAVLSAYRRGTLGASVRTLALTGRTPREVAHLLLARGFACGVRPVAAPRTVRGEARWLTKCGDETDTLDDAALFLFLVFAHPDGGLVELFPTKDPGGRHVPLNAPAAKKYVLFEPACPLAEMAASGAESATAASNRVFAVSDNGDFVPKGARVAHGIVYDPQDLVRSYHLAEERRLFRSVIPLREEPAGQPGG